MKDYSLSTKCLLNTLAILNDNDVISPLITGIQQLERHLEVCINMPDDEYKYVVGRINEMEEELRAFCMC